MKQIPALPELTLGLERALQHHLEVELRGKKSALLRMAGREFRVVDVDEPPEVLVDHICQSLSEVAAYGLATALTDDSPAGTRLRMDLITALAHIESTKGPGKEKHAPDGELLLTTAEAAHQLGMSRPYVSMLCNQGKLGAVHRSEGGHRRIRQSAIEDYKRAHSNGAATANQ
jgi:excisionase family DNA binding protein